jgi:hypothetical protein
VSGLEGLEPHLRAFLAERAPLIVLVLAIDENGKLVVSGPAGAVLRPEVGDTTITVDLAGLVAAAEEEEEEGAP